MKPRGLYGQSEGNERRNQSASFQERLEDDALIEGPHIAVLKRMAEESDWKAYNEYVKELKDKGFSQKRIDAMVAQSTFKLPQLKRR